MNEEEYTCIKKVVKTVRLALPATFVTKEITGVTEILDSWKRQYIHQLQGIVVSYENVKLASHSGFISIQKPFVYYNVTATFHLFCPVVGDIVKGKINRTSREHIGCLVQNTINVTIHLSQTSSSELSKYIYLEGEILFEVTHFDFERKAIRVTGEVTPRCLELMNDLFPDPEELINNDEQDSQALEDIGYSKAISSSDEETVMLRKNPPISLWKTSPKKRKRESESSQLDSLDDEVLFKNQTISPMKTNQKKSKKLKRDSKSSQFDSIDDQVLLKNSTFSPMKTNRKNPKKQKRDSESSQLDSLEESIKKMKKKWKDGSSKTSNYELDLNKPDTKMFDVNQELVNLNSFKHSNSESPKKKIKNISPKKKKNKHHKLETNELTRSLEQVSFDAPNTLSTVIKNEIPSSPEKPTNSIVLNEKKRKRESSQSEAETESKMKKKKKHKDKGKDKKKSKDKKVSKKKAKLIASGDVLNKDKKKSSKNKGKSKGQKDKKSKHKSKKIKDKKNKKIKLEDESGNEKYVKNEPLD